MTCPAMEGLRVADLDSDIGAERLWRLRGRGESELPREDSDGRFPEAWHGVSWITWSRGEPSGRGRFRAGKGVSRMTFSAGGDGCGGGTSLVDGGSLDVTRTTCSSSSPASSSSSNSSAGPCDSRRTRRWLCDGICWEAPAP